MAGIRGRTGDGAEMFRCPLCGGQVYAKVLFVGPRGELRGILSAMCADCNAAATVTLPPDVAPSAHIPEHYYTDALTKLKPKA